MVVTVAVGAVCVVHLQERVVSMERVLKRIIRQNAEANQIIIGQLVVKTKVDLQICAYLVAVQLFQIMFINICRIMTT